jgi:hypothetical protein
MLTGVLNAFPYPAPNLDVKPSGSVQQGAS